jgi:hypothetical protein
MELVRAAQSARRAKLELAAPPIADSIFDDASESSGDEAKGLHAAESGFVGTDAPQPIALPPAVDHGMKEVMEARRRRQAAADGTGATPAGIVMQCVAGEATELLLEDLMLAAGVSSPAGIRGDRNGLFVANTRPAREAWLKVADETRRVLDLASDAAEADDAYCIARGEYDDLSSQYEFMRDDLSDAERVELEDELEGLRAFVHRPADGERSPNALLLNGVLVWQQAIAAMGHLEQEGTACAPIVFKLYKAIQSLYARVQALDARGVRA